LSRIRSARDNGGNYLLLATAADGVALLDRAPDFGDLLDADPDGRGFAALRRSERIGRPLGAHSFQDAISRRLGRAVTPGKRGPDEYMAKIAAKRIAP
jgi:hypothetical protein